MSRYALSKYSPSYYLKQFREDRIEIQPAREAGVYEIVGGELRRAGNGSTSGIQLEESPGAGILTIVAGHSSFDLCFPCEGSRVEPHYIRIGREVLGQIIAMDAAARALTQQKNYREELAYVEIAAEGVALRYFANTGNVEWEVSFRREEDGLWVLRDGA